MTLNLLLLLADVTPDLAQLQAAGADADHHAVVQLGIATLDALAKAEMLRFAG